VIAALPLDAGAVKVTLADALPAVAVTPVGAPGTVQQTPLRQEPAQTLPQLPQLLVSVCKFLHVLLQSL
jgi:hypothetical protein